MYIVPGVKKYIHVSKEFYQCIYRRSHTQVKFLLFNIKTLVAKPERNPSDHRHPGDEAQLHVVMHCKCAMVHFEEAFDKYMYSYNPQDELNGSKRKNISGNRIKDWTTKLRLTINSITEELEGWVLAIHARPQETETQYTVVLGDLFLTCVSHGAARLMLIRA